MPGPLAGVKVLDLSRFVAGPVCAMMLGDLGADVVKVEKPGTGEDTRRLAPQVGGDSLFIMAFNRNKRSLALDTRHPRGQDLLRELASRADVVVENFRPGVMEAMGCGWDVLRGLNDRLIMARISGYGQEGPWAERPCFDAVAQAASGLMHMTGQAEGPPTLAGTTIIDHATGLHAAVGVLAALQARHTTGSGQLVDVALLDSALSLLMTAIPEQRLLGRPTGRVGNRDRYGAPSSTFETADGIWIHIVAGGDPRFERFAKAAALDHLLADPRFADNPARMAHADILEAEVADWMGTKTADQVERLMAEAQVPCGRVVDIAGAIDSDQVRHRGSVVEVTHCDAGRVPMQGFVPRLSDTPAARGGHVPTVGEHSREILADWLGMDDATVAALVADDIMQAGIGERA